MAYLDNEILKLETILTKKGRDLLVDGGLNITKFALADDEINYSLWNPKAPSGSAYYDLAIDNNLIMEPTMDDSKLMKSLLIKNKEIEEKSNFNIFIDIGLESFNIYLNSNVLFSPNTIGLNNNEIYDVTLKDSKFITLRLAEELYNPLSFGIGYIKKTGNNFIIQTKNLSSVPSTFTSWTTEIIITGITSEKRKTIPITILKR